MKKSKPVQTLNSISSTGEPVSAAAVVSVNGGPFQIIRDENSGIPRVVQDIRPGAYTGIVNNQGHTGAFISSEDVCVSIPKWL